MVSHNYQSINIKEAILIRIWLSKLMQSKHEGLPHWYSHLKNRMLVGLYEKMVKAVPINYWFIMGKTERKIFNDFWKKMFSLQWHFWTIFGPILCIHSHGTFFLGIHPTHETRAIDFMISPHQHDNISKLLKMNTVESKSDYIYHHSPWILDKFKFSTYFCAFLSSAVP